MENENYIIRCSDGCGKTFLSSSVRLIHELVDKQAGVAKVYFKCPHCGVEYICFYEDRYIRHLRGRLCKLTTAKSKDRIREMIAQRIKHLKEIYNTR